MKGAVNKQVRFVNKITDISQCFVDIYQSVGKNQKDRFIFYLR